MEEDNNVSLPNSTINACSAAVSQQGEDIALQRKRAAMLERLTNLQQSRVARRSSSDSSATESTQSFLNRFNQFKLSIETLLSTISQVSMSPDSINAKSQLQNVALSISDLEKFVAENSYFLPSYEVRTCLKTISDLRQSLDGVTSQVIPKKKFSFGKKKKISVPSPDPIIVETQAESQNFCGNKFSAGEEIVGFTHILESSPGFRGKEGEVLVREFNSDGEVGEFTLSHLDGCEVSLKGSLRALFVNKLRDCRIYVGPVFGSVLIEEVEGCIFVLASHQIRIHNAKRCDFYLRVRSRPIIEDCTDVRFAPYSLRYDGIEKDLEKANLSEETGNWANVDDFRWLRSVQSPNWSVLPEKERVVMLDISNLGI